MLNCQFLCLLFTLYFFTISGLVYLVSQTPACHTFLIKLVGQEFITQHLDIYISSRQLIKANALFVIPLMIELITDFPSNYKLDNDIAIIIEMYEKPYRCNQLEWNESIKAEFVSGCNKIIDDHLPGGCLTRMIDDITDFIHSSNK